VNRVRNDLPKNELPSLSSTLFLGGGSVVLGIIQLAIGWRGMTAPGEAVTSSSDLAAIASGALFVTVGLTVLARDFAGARNNEEVPENAPPFLRFAANLLNIVLLAIFAIIASVLASGALFDLQPQLGSLATPFRIFMGALALVLWYGVARLTVSLLNRGGRAK